MHAHSLDGMQRTSWLTSWRVWMPVVLGWFVCRGVAANGAIHEGEGGMRFTAGGFGPAATAARVQVRERFARVIGMPLPECSVHT